MGSFLNAVDSLKFAELFWEIRNELEAQVAEERPFSSLPPEPSTTGSPQGAMTRGHQGQHLRLGLW